MMTASEWATTSCMSRAMRTRSCSSDVAISASAWASRVARQRSTIRHPKPPSHGAPSVSMLTMASTTSVVTVLATAMPSPTSPFTNTICIAATMPPSTADPSPTQRMRADPQAAVAYSTPRIAMLTGSGPRPAASCTMAPSHATARAMPGERRPIASAPNCRMPAMISAPTPADSAMVALNWPGA